MILRPLVLLVCLELSFCAAHAHRRHAQALRTPAVPPWERAPVLCACAHCLSPLTAACGCACAAAAEAEGATGAVGCDECAQCCVLRVWCGCGGPWRTGLSPLVAAAALGVITLQPRTRAPPRRTATATATGAGAGAVQPIGQSAAIDIEVEMEPIPHATPRAVRHRTTTTTTRHHGTVEWAIRCGVSNSRRRV